MTSRYSHSRNKPLFLTPAGKDYLWGGRRLNDEFAKEIPLSPLAETWECSTHPDGESVVASGEFTGQTLRAVLRAHTEYLGTRCENPNGELPILIKFIDAKRDLSVQVHPDDAFAFTHEQGQKGKSEMWYVLDATRDAHLVYGLSRDASAEALRNAISTGTLERYLQKVPVQTDDVFYLEAGTIHAIGAGCLIAEIQENSNLTYRLYDYDRTDKNGQKRPLHIEKALMVANLKSSAAPRQPMRVLKYRPGYASELLCRCPYFQVERLLLNTERIRQRAALYADTLSFQVLLCVQGCGSISCGEETRDFFKGDCIFIPADTVLTLHGRAQFLLVRC